MAGSGAPSNSRANVVNRAAKRDLGQKDDAVFNVENLRGTLEDGTGLPTRELKANKGQGEIGMRVERKIITNRQQKPSSQRGT